MKQPPRESLCELREHHHALVMNLAVRKRQGKLVPLEEYAEYLTENYHRVFGWIRKSKANDIPSDRTREWIIIAKLMHEVRECREANELARSRISNRQSESVAGRM